MINWVEIPKKKKRPLFKGITIQRTTWTKTQTFLNAKRKTKLNKTKVADIICLLQYLIQIYYGEYILENIYIYISYTTIIMGSEGKMEVNVYVQCGMTNYNK